MLKFIQRVFLLHLLNYYFVICLDGATDAVYEVVEAIQGNNHYTITNNHTILLFQILYPTFTTRTKTPKRMIERREREGERERER